MWFGGEFREFGYGFPPLGKRFDQLEEALTIISTLWRGETVEFKGEYYDMQGAVCSPAPIGLRLWIGGRDKARTVEFTQRFVVGDDRLSYFQTTLVDIYGKKNFEHTDENELIRA